MEMTKATLRALAALAAGLLFSLQAWAVCVSAGAFVSGTNQCCASIQGTAVLNGPLYKDANSRCQIQGCKTVGQVAALDEKTGISSCCFGLAPVPDGKLPATYTCQVPSLLQTKCATLGSAPTNKVPCCVGLVRSTTTLKCVLNTTARQCNSVEASQGCCFPPDVNRCKCFCSSPYYKGT